MVANVDESNVISITTIIESGDRMVRYRVHEMHKRILLHFPNQPFDFRLVDMKDYPKANRTMLSGIEGLVLYDGTEVSSNDDFRCVFTELPSNSSGAYAITFHSAPLSQIQPELVNDLVVLNSNKLGWGLSRIPEGTLPYANQG